MEQIPIPHPTFFKTVEDNDSFLSSLREKQHLLTKLRDILREVHSSQFKGASFVPATVKDVEEMARKKGLPLEKLPNNLEIILLLHDIEQAIYDIEQFILFYNVTIEGLHILSYCGEADKFVWKATHNDEGKRCFRWLHDHLETINKFLPCSIEISEDGLPVETVEFIDYLIKGDNWTVGTNEVGFYKGRKQYTEEEYIGYYYSVFPNLLDTDIEDLLRRHYKALRMIQRQAWRMGKGVCDYAGYELEVTPIEGIFNYGYCILTYIPKTQSLLGLGASVEITEIPDGLQEKAASMAMKLFDCYGTIYVDYSNLEKEYERMRSQFSDSQFFKSDLE